MEARPGEHGGLVTAARHPWRCLSAAIRFLTVLPLPGSGDDKAASFGGALFYFTITGICVGGGIAALALVLRPVLPPVVTAVLLAIALSLISGFFHLDGLADTADGFMSAKPRARCLDIMRDSRIGVMGAAAVAALLLLKTAALTAVDGGELVAALIIAPAAGRTAIVLSMAVLPYAREGGGLGALFYSDSTRLAAVLSGALLVAVMAVLAPGRLAALMLAVCVTVLWFSWLCRSRIGGATGDTLGAVCELTEAVMLVVFTVAL